MTVFDKFSSGSIGSPLDMGKMFESSLAAEAVMTRFGTIWFSDAEFGSGRLLRWGEFVGECCRASWYW